MASLSDILTTLQNGVQAINTLSATWRRGQGNVTSAVITTDTLIQVGNGFLVSFWVTVAGSGDGTIHNAGSIAAAGSTNVIALIPQTVGFMQVNNVFNLGLVVKPGTAQNVVVTYYSGP